MQMLYLGAGRICAKSDTIDDKKFALGFRQLGVLKEPRLLLNAQRSIRDPFITKDVRQLISPAPFCQTASGQR